MARLAAFTLQLINKCSHRVQSRVNAASLERIMSVCYCIDYVDLAMLTTIVRTCGGWLYTDVLIDGTEHANLFCYLSASLECGVNVWSLSDGKLYRDCALGRDLAHDTLPPYYLRSPLTPHLQISHHKLIHTGYSHFYATTSCPTFRFNIPIFRTRPDTDDAARYNSKDNASRLLISEVKLLSLG